MPLYEEYGQMGQIYSVSSLTELIRSELERSFPFVWVRGEVADYSVSSSGHMYFGLKDASSLLQCVWFAGRRKRNAGQTFDPLTGEVFEEPRPDLEKLMRNGLELVCAGSINLYAKSGRYQLLVEHAELSGEGALALALEQRKAKYAAAGYFSLERKRPLPANPLRIALITSPKGAAIHDFLKLAAMRGISSAIRLFPVSVQGKGAALQMAQAIEEANRQDWAEAIVLIRGGGSTEDLMEFNEPALVEAIFNSRLPVLAGIGHEVDVFLSDLTADVRAATPSHAAQILWPLRRDIWQKLDDLDIALGRRTRERLERLQESLLQKQRALGWLSPRLRLGRLEAELTQLERSLVEMMKTRLEREENALAGAALKMAEASMLCARLDLAGERLGWMARSAFTAFDKLLERKAGRLEEKLLRLGERTEQLLGVREALLSRMELLLASVNPLRPLERGYALLKGQGGIVHSVSSCEPGQELEARLLDGTLELTVKAVHKNGDSIHA